MNFSRDPPTHLTSDVITSSQTSIIQLHVPADILWWTEKLMMWLEILLSGIQRKTGLTFWCRKQREVGRDLSCGCLRLWLESWEEIGVALWGLNAEGFFFSLDREKVVIWTPQLTLTVPVVPLIHYTCFFGLTKHSHLGGWVAWKWILPWFWKAESEIRVSAPFEGLWRVLAFPWLLTASCRSLPGCPMPPTWLLPVCVLCSVAESSLFA